MAVRTTRPAPRLHVAAALQRGSTLALPAEAARHAQVLRLQPGDPLTLFNGQGGEWSARVTEMGRRTVAVRIGDHAAMEREAARTVHLAVALIASERMDWLLEKAVELGAASLTPLVTERTNPRLTAERMEKKMEHWRAVVIAASEQCGRNRLLEVRASRRLDAFLQTDHAGARWLLSASAAAPALRGYTDRFARHEALNLLSGPEGGFSAEENRAAMAAGFVPVSLGPRVLRAETAPLAALALLTTP